MTKDNFQHLVFYFLFLQVLTVRSWHERLDQLAASGQMASCLQLARQMVLGKALAVVGLSHRRSKRRAELATKITQLVEHLMDSWWSQGSVVARGEGEKVRRGGGGINYLPSGAID